VSGFRTYRPSRDGIWWGPDSFYFYGLFLKLVSLMVFIARGVKYVLEINLILQLELDVTFLVIDRSEVGTR